VTLSEFEVVWPLSRVHYLAVPDPEMVTMSVIDEPLSQPLMATPGRELAARALLGGACTQQRVSDLLGVSRRTIGRMADADCSTGLRDPQVLEGARTCLEETASRGSTAAERMAAAAWLQEAARDEHQVVRTRGPPPPPVLSPVVRPTPRGLPRRPRRQLAPRNGSTSATPATPGPPVTPLPQVDALRRQQQRILHRSALIDYVLAAEKRGGETLTMGDALAELLADITEAARTIGTLLQIANGQP
jgi:hypothetical protein